jgi:hypothetical protein
MSELYTMSGERIPVGQKDDPNSIGPDDRAAYAPRTEKELVGVPQALLDVEVKHLVPVANQVATAIGITFLQEAQYGNVLTPIRERSVFVVLNVLKAKIDAGVATYHGLVIMCKRHPIVRVVCKCHLETGRFGVAQVHLWNKDPSEPSGGRYYLYGDPEMKKPMPQAELVTLILEYLENRERVLTLV